MSIKLQLHGFYHSSSSNPLVSQNSIGNHGSCKKMAYLDSLLTTWVSSRKKCLIRPASSVNGNSGLNFRLGGYRKHYATFSKSRRMEHRSLLASTEDGITINGSPQACTSSDFDEMRVKLKQSWQGEDYSYGLVQSLHDAARVFEVSIREKVSLSKLSWFPTAWLGVDRNAWLRTLSYEAAVYSLLQAATEISSRGDSRDRGINIFVQRSLLRQAAPLESLIREKLSAKQPEAYDWLLSEQVPVLVSSFVNYFEGDPWFAASNTMYGKGTSLGAGSASDISLLMLALTCIAAITKLGPAKISCSHFFSMIPDITGRLMDMLVDFVPLHQVYHSIKDIGLSREFLVHFGPRAGECRVKDDRGSEEVIFWVNLIQKQLQQAIDREKIWSRLTTSESIEVLERDLAIFGFFITLGRSTQSFLSANGFEIIDYPIESFIRYLIGGCVLYYPQLSSISLYQLYVEVVCEELDWFPFYPGNNDIPKQFHGHGSKIEGPPNAETISKVLDVCSHWMQSFIKYSKWLENPSNVKATRFLSRGQNQLMECMEELRISKSGIQTISVERTGSAVDKDSDSFDKALEGVEEALNRLENLLQELHVSSSYSRKEKLKGACSDLEKIRKLKKEAEFLEVSFRAKAALLRQDDDDDDDGSSKFSTSEWQQYLKGRKRNSANMMLAESNRSVKESRGFWSFLAHVPVTNSNAELSAVEKSGNEVVQQSTSNVDSLGTEPNEIHRFEQLRDELMELERRVKRSAYQSENKEEMKVRSDFPHSGNDLECPQVLWVQKQENIIGKSLDKLKKTSMDVLQGTQLLAIDVGASMGLLRRVLIGDELTEKERKAFQRTLIDLASVVPIGVLMLLPVTAVGHAAILAAIQRYVPSLIPSTYGSERLDLLRQLEKVKQMETSETDPKEKIMVVD